MVEDNGEGVGSPGHMSMWLHAMDTEAKKSGPITKVKKKFEELLYRHIQAKISKDMVCRISVPEIAAILDKALTFVVLESAAPGVEPDEAFIDSMKVRARHPSLPPSLACVSLRVC